MPLIQQIEFYRQQYLTAKRKDVALVAFGAYAALTLLAAEALPTPKPSDTDGEKL